MMKIRHLLYVGTALLVAGCSGDENLSNATPSEEGKTQLVIEATLGTGNAVTRAAGKNFAENDQLLAYLRHTTGTTKGSYSLVTTDKSPLLVTFTKGNVAMSTVDANTNRTVNDLTPHIPLYWEDFSNSASDDTDLRTDGHGLQSYYGYCYNGGTPSTALTQTTGELGWTVQTDQRTAANFQHSDLLWSPEQETTPYYKGGMAFTATHALSIPYTHAMSEVTVEVNVGAGFDGSTNPLGQTILTLHGMNTVASLEAPKGVTGGYSSTTPDNIVMLGEDYTSGVTKRTYTAIVAPGTKLKEGAELLDIVNVEDNNYKLQITDAMLATDKWATGHTLQTDNQDNKHFIETLPGYNYKLVITLKKTAIEVEATLADWTTVTATGEGEIQFPTVDFTMSGSNFTNGSSIYLFQLLHNAESDTKAERTNAKYGSYATVSTYSTSTGKWTNSPLIYWPNQTNTYYFRALSQNSNAVAQETDVLWGTTPAHSTYTEGAAIAPRKNEVPIAFKHAMSKVTFQLETASGTEGPNSPVVDLTGARIAISNLATSGTIAIEDGAITPAATTAAAITATAAPITDLIVIPQTIGSDAIVTITLTDGTTYKLKLSECVESGTTTPITQWERGQSYTYTIHLEKEQIQFRALIEDWEEKTGSGNAYLEWD